MIQIKHKITGVVLYETSNADLSNADLGYAILSNANLSNADLSNANLSNADLSNANLSNANLSNADLSNANLSNADLSNANLSNASIAQDVMLIGERPIVTLGVIGSRLDSLIVFITNQGLRFSVGCQHCITKETFIDRIQCEHGDNVHAKEYLAAIAFAEVHAELWTPSSTDKVKE